MALKSFIKLAVIFSLLSLSGLTYAKDPIKCPSIDAIKKVQFTIALEDPSNPGSWGALQAKNKYDTEDEWNFAVINIKALSAEETYSKAVDALYLLGEPEGPGSAGGEELICTYPNNHDYLAIAMTPPFFNKHSIFKRNM